MPNNNDFPIQELAYLKALSSPVRQEIVDTVNAMGTCSVPELADALGRPADSLYYHIRELQRAGLILEIEKRARGRHKEQILGALTSKIMRLGYQPDDPENVKAINKIVRSMLRVTEREFEKGLEHDQLVAEGPSRNLNASRQKAWLTSTELKEVNQLLGKLQHIFHTAKRRKNTSLQSLTFVVAPFESKTRNSPEA